jgi:hypothetical protein
LSAQKSQALKKTPQNSSKFLQDISEAGLKKIFDPMSCLQKSSTVASISFYTTLSALRYADVIPHYSGSRAACI